MLLDKLSVVEVRHQFWPHCAILRVVDHLSQRLEKLLVSTPCIHQAREQCPMLAPREGFTSTSKESPIHMVPTFRLRGINSPDCPEIDNGNTLRGALKEHDIPEMQIIVCPARAVNCRECTDNLCKDRGLRSRGQTQDSRRDF